MLSLLEQKRTLSNLKMIKHISSLPDCYKRYLKILKTANDHGVRLRDWDAYFFYNCIRALMPGTRYYWSNKKWNWQGGQGLETSILKHKLIKEFYTLGKQIRALNNEETLKEFYQIESYVDEPIDDFIAANECIFVEYRKDKDNTYNRLYIEWHDVFSCFSDIFECFYQYIERLKEGCLKSQGIIDKYKGVSSC